MQLSNEYKEGAWGSLESPEMHLRSPRRGVKRFINVKPLRQAKQGLKNNNKRGVENDTKQSHQIPCCVE